MFSKASLKLVYDAGLGDSGNQLTKSKTYSNVVEGAADSDLLEVAEAIGGLCSNDLFEVYHVIQNQLM